VVLKAPNIPNQVKNEEPVPKLFAAIGDSITSYSKVGTQAAGGALLLGSLCSLNIGPAFIKLFQIIEILGKFYFSPIEFSALMDYFLSKLFGLSDIIDTRKDIIISNSTNADNRQYKKLTSLQQDRNILRSTPVFVIAYIALYIAIAIIPTGKCTGPSSRRFATAFEMIMKIQLFIFELSFVDFAFYASYALVGSWSLDNCKSPIFWLNKLISMFMLHECSLFVVLVVHTALCSTRGHHHRRPGSMLGRNPFYSAGEEIVMEHLPSKLQGHKIARLSNSIYIGFIFLFQILLTTTQHIPGFGLGLLFSTVCINFIFFSVLMLTVYPFKTLLNCLQMFSYELCITTFVCSIIARKLGIHHPYADYVVVALTLVVIVIQVLATAKAIIEQIRVLILKLISKQKEDCKEMKKTDLKLFESKSRPLMNQLSPRSTMQNLNDTDKSPYFRTRYRTIMTAKSKNTVFSKESVNNPVTFLSGEIVQPKEAKSVKLMLSNSSMLERDTKCKDDPHKDTPRSRIRTARSQRLTQKHLTVNTLSKVSITHILKSKQKFMPRDKI